MDLMYSVVDFLFDTVQGAIDLIMQYWLLQLMIFIPLVGKVINVFKRRFL